MERTDDVLAARAEMELSLRFTGNPALSQVGRCCIGAYFVHEYKQSVISKLQNV